MKTAPTVPTGVEQFAVALSPPGEAESKIATWYRLDGLRTDGSFIEDTQIITGTIIWPWLSIWNSFDINFLASENTIAEMRSQRQIGPVIKDPAIDRYLATKTSVTLNFWRDTNPEQWRKFIQDWMNFLDHARLFYSDKTDQIKQIYLVGLQGLL